MAPPHGPWPSLITQSGAPALAVNVVCIIERTRPRRDRRTKRKTRNPPEGRADTQTRQKKTAAAALPVPCVCVCCSCVRRRQSGCAHMCVRVYTCLYFMCSAGAGAGSHMCAVHGSMRALPGAGAQFKWHKTAANTLLECTLLTTLTEREQPDRPTDRRRRRAYFCVNRTAPTHTHKRWRRQQPARVVEGRGPTAQTTTSVTTV